MIDTEAGAFWMQPKGSFFVQPCVMIVQGAKKDGQLPEIQHSGGRV